MPQPRNDQRRRVAATAADGRRLELTAAIDERMCLRLDGAKGTVARSAETGGDGAGQDNGRVVFVRRVSVRRIVVHSAVRSVTVAGPNRDGSIGSGDRRSRCDTEIPILVVVGSYGGRAGELRSPRLDHDLGPPPRPRARPEDAPSCPCSRPRRPGGPPLGVRGDHQQQPGLPVVPVLALRRGQDLPRDGAAQRAHPPPGSLAGDGEVLPYDVQRLRR